MTQTVAPAGRSTDDSGPVPSSSRRRWIAFAAMVVLIAGAASGLAWASAAARGAVDLSLAGDVDCVGAPVHHRVIDGQNGALIVVKKGLTCTLTVSIHNGGSFGTTVDSVTIPGMGAYGGWGTQVKEIGGVPRADIVGNRTDAVFRLALPIAAGDTVTIEVPIRFAPRGCSSPGDLATVGEPVQAAVSSLGVSGTRALAFPLAFRGTDDTSCGR